VSSLVKTPVVRFTTSTDPVLCPTANRISPLLIARASILDGIYKSKRKKKEKKKKKKAGLKMLIEVHIQKVRVGSGGKKMSN